MALTGRFNFRKTLMGRIVLQIEEEVRTFSSHLTGKNKLRRRWRDATMMDLAAPELRSLVDLRFRPRYLPQGYEPAQDWPKGARQLEATPAPTVHYDTYQEDGRLSTH